VQRRLEGLHESNPMMGLRGCRLGTVHPEITEMQVGGRVGFLGGGGWGWGCRVHAGGRGWRSQACICLQACCRAPAHLLLVLIGMCCLCSPIGSYHLPQADCYAWCHTSKPGG
jgi:hypothetical protein